MALLSWLPDVLQAAGCKVRVLPGWSHRQTRNGFNPTGLVIHHTVTGRNWPDDRVAHLLRDGHTNLKGPLSQLGLQRDGTFVVVAAGRCNHNGYGRFGNDAIGIEGYNDGKGEPWPTVQYDAYVTGTAAICRHLGWGADRVLGHKETDPGRKTDPTFDMNAFRQRVSQLLHPVAPLPEDEVTPEDIDKIADAVTDRLVLHLTNLSVGIDASLVRRGLVAETDAKGGGAVGELRRNVRKIAETVGVEADDIER